MAKTMWESFGGFISVGQAPVIGLGGFKMMVR